MFSGGLEDSFLQHAIPTEREEHAKEIHRSRLAHELAEKPHRSQKSDVKTAKAERPYPPFGLG